MLFANYIVGLLALVVAPPYFLRKRDGTNRTLSIGLGLAVSLTFSWIFFFIQNYLELPPASAQILSYSVAAFVLIHAVKQKRLRVLGDLLGEICIGLVFLFPLWPLFGQVFTSWDALASWNRWAIEIFEGSYQPEGTAYPVLLPAYLSMTYFFQGTAEIWWTAKITLAILPASLIMLALSLYQDTKDKFFLAFLILFYPYLVNKAVISGLSDFPVMIAGAIGLVFLYAADRSAHEDSKFDSALALSFLFGGIASVIKQAGLAFFVVSITYAILNRKRIGSRAHVSIAALVALMFPVSFLLLFYQFSSDPAGNIEYLRTLSAGGLVGQRALSFFSLPPSDSVLVPLMLFLSVFAMVSAKFRSKRTTNVVMLSFFAVGVVAWYVAFSYDARNALWAKAFLVLPSATVLSLILDRTVSRTALCGLVARGKGALAFSSKLVPVLVCAFIAIVLYVATRGDSTIYTIQARGQEEIGRADIALRMNALLNDTDPCTVLVTNRLMLPLNYHLRNHRDRMIADAWGRQDLLELHRDHSCSSGRYLIFGEWSLSLGDDETSRDVQELIDLGRIIEIDRLMRIYFVLPQVEN